MWDAFPEIAAELELVEKYLKKKVYSRNRALSEITKDLVTAGGKRLRPALVILCSKFGRYESDKVIPAAAAIEALHTATLVHDDIVDRSKTRRGQPTVSEKYGTDMAVYTGDFLFTKAILMFSGNLSVSQLEKVARAVKAICEGEVDQFIDRFNPNASVSSYLKKTARKTAVLFGAACAIGANAADCSNEVTERLARFGLNYGMAFQIRDDLNDLTLSEEQSGKPVYHDISKGIITLPVIYALMKNPSFKASFEILKGTDKILSTKETADLIGIVKDCDGLGDAEKTLRKYVERGRRQLEGLRDGPYAGVLDSLITRLL